MLINHTPAAGVLCLLVMIGLSMSAAMDQWSMYNEEFGSYSNFEIDSENSVIIIATTNFIYHLSLDLNTQTDAITVEPEEEALNFCTLTDLREDRICQNIHRVLVLPHGPFSITGSDGTVWNSSDTVLTCGSNAFQPLCRYRKRTDLTEIRTYSGEQFNPYGPFTFIPSLWASNGRLVVATSQNTESNQFGITMSGAPFQGSVEVTTRVHAFNRNFRWFNLSPTFISMYEIGDYIYLFFKEEALEAEMKVIYSRVARVCKDDIGDVYEGTTIFTTYLKARMSCTSGTEVPYYYNDISDTHYDQDQQLLYAIFQSAQNGPLGSVVCVYTLDDLEEVFNGNYLVESSPLHFEIEKNFNAFTCAVGSRSEEEARRVQLMQSIATQTSPGPAFTMQGHALQRMVMDTVKGHEVMFITSTRESDDALVMLKVLVKTQNGTTITSYYHVIDTTILSPAPSDNSSHKVTKMQLYGEGASAHVYIGTETDIYRIPVQSCSAHTSCCECVTTRDPYCGFDKAAGTCVSLSTSNSQNLTRDLVDGNTDVCLASVTIQAPVSTGKLCNSKSSSPTANTEGETTPSTDSGSTTAGGAYTGTVSETGLKGAMEISQPWIIVGTVGGFILGFVIAIILMFLFSRMRNRRNKKELRGITNESDGRNRKDSGNTIHPTEVLRINNSITEFTNSNNFARSGNDYTQHIPPHVHMKEVTGPVKYPLNSPKGAAAAAGTVGTKCIPASPPPPSKSHPPSVFTFTPPNQSTPTKNHTHNSTHVHAAYHAQKPTYSNSIAGASAHSETPHHQVSAASAEKQSHTDPNFQKDYKAKVYLTESQKEAYGGNILTRLPSIDGSKSKFFVGDGGRSSRPGSYSSDSLPRGIMHHKRQDLQRGHGMDMVHLDTELGCSQC